MRKLLLYSMFLLSMPWINAQYVEPEKKDKEEMIRKQNEKIIFPSQKFDSVAAKNMLAIGKGKISGVAFTRVREDKNFGLKTGPKVYANKLKIILFPVTSYFNEYYTLWKDKSKHNPKRNRFVQMVPEAYRYRLESITNSSGEFTFPDMRPGKYYIFATLDYYTTHSGRKYTGSGYDNYGRIDYYEPYTYQKNGSEFLELFVEVKQEGEVVKVKLK
ncbi:carboxypeptidase-like regulatory domain-containing protein [Faecalibacter sp. LW9]|uniref:carboxypeptidase-like regulatory domain-containing protein n=1 Tax=Faecalibacter sp. LW9 TaxID=3103144 RepID=UPI002AFF400D|nr:carboxypeptidase-like regulatory domain-containing protein [Faecalibacter sp. LW9]